MALRSSTSRSSPRPRPSRMFSSTRCCATRSSWIAQPLGRCGKPRSTSRMIEARVPPTIARKRASKRNRRCAPPMKSRTVRHALSGRRRSPRPSCWRKSDALSVGRRNSTVSTSGTSTPSLSRSTEKTARRSPRWSLSRASARSRIGVRCESATEERPAAVNFCATNSACSISTQKPSARIAAGVARSGAGPRGAPAESRRRWPYRGSGASPCRSPSGSSEVVAREVGAVADAEVLERRQQALGRAPSRGAAPRRCGRRTKATPSVRRRAREWLSALRARAGAGA